MQSGLGNTKKWFLMLEKNIADKKENLMGFASSFDNINQVKLSFDSKEKAVEYASSKGISYVVVENNDPIRKPKSYSSGFTKDPSLYYL